MKIFKTFYISLFLIIILSCNGNVYNVYTSEIKNTEQESVKSIKFQMVMMDFMPKAWSPIKIFEISQTNSPYDKESLEIKTCISKLASHNLANIKNNEFDKIKKEFKISYSSLSPDLENKIYNYIDYLSIYLDFIIEKTNNSIYSVENPVATWEKDITLIDPGSKANANLTANKNLFVAIREYKFERNQTIGPLSQILEKSESEIFESNTLFHMRDFLSQSTNIPDTNDNDNIDYYFWQANKEKFINSSICAK